MGSRIKESPESIFEVYLEVNHTGTAGSDPEVRRRFPEGYIDQETLQTVPRFCFPFSAESLSASQVGQNFTFVLTDIESKQRFGFCRLSSGAHSCYCILSYLPWFEVFYKLLNILADYTVKGQDSQWRELLESLHTLPIPEPGVPVHLSVHSYFTVPDLRDLPSIPENRNLTEYFVAVDVNNMLHLYASMLYERRILICCSKLSTLTACVHGSAAMLYPMYWQHVYIPVLPQHLIDYCCAPMPYLIGVHSSLMEKVRGMALDDVVLLNVDTNTLETPFDDLQSLPNDVVSSLKNRLKKVSTTTGDGVARAFLKTQAALFGSYRSALVIEPGEPITFSEDTFGTHRSNTMRQFLQNAIQLQLFKQFIDGRLDLLNAGEGFSDVFEEEINMGEYAGSDKTYHQWLFTVKKEGGAIFNRVKTKANPAMKHVYKFAKDHARMGLKEVKSRLKQKEENGYSTTGSASSSSIAEDGMTLSPTTTGGDRKESASRTWDDRRPITVHFGQARPPRPLVAKRPRSNIGMENSPDQPQPYRSLKEAGFAEGEEPALGPERHTAPPSPVMEKFSDINLLGDMFSCQDEPDSQPLSLAKSLEELRTPKDPNSLLQANFTYQRMDLSGSERTRTLPGLKHSNPYSKLWSSGQNETSALPGTEPPVWDRPLSVPPPDLQEPQPPSRESPVMSSQGSITIPRPQGRKTPEPGQVLAPPAPQPRVKTGGAAEPGATPGGQEFRQALGMSSSSDGGGGGDDLLKHTTLNQEEDVVDLLTLLDPLTRSDRTGSAPPSEPSGPPSSSSTSSSSKPALPPRPYPQSLPPFPPAHPHAALNPFSQSLHYTSPHRHYSPAVAAGNHYSPTLGGNPFGSSAYMSPLGPYFHATPLPQPQPLSTLPGFLYRQPSPVSPAVRSVFPPPPTSSSTNALSSLLDSPSGPPPGPAAGARPSEQQDPFGELLAMAKPAAPVKKKVEDLRRRWETFD
ncbi:LOW QUALITY PROTEIN: DENN domain-containing protein 1A [Aplochiton taeniatus]